MNPAADSFINCSTSSDATDEVRHARLARTHAERLGAIPEADVVLARGRSLEGLALDNAREGSVEETFGAVLARIDADARQRVREARASKIAELEAGLPAEARAAFDATAPAMA